MDLSELAIVPVELDEEAQFRVLMQAHHYLVASHKIGAARFSVSDCKHLSQGCCVAVNQAVRRRRAPKCVSNTFRGNSRNKKLCLDLSRGSNYAVANPFRSRLIGKIALTVSGNMPDSIRFTPHSYKSDDGNNEIIEQKSAVSVGMQSQ